jgi:hypothetical protein
MNNLLQFRMLNVRKSHRQPQCNFQLVCEDRLLFVSVDLYVSLRRQRRLKCERAILLEYPSSFCKILYFIQPRKQKSNGVRSEHSNSSILITMLN